MTIISVLTPAVLAKLVELVIAILRARGSSTDDDGFAHDLAKYLLALAQRYESGESLDQLASAPLQWARDLDEQELFLRIKLLGEARDGGD